MIGGGCDIFASLLTRETYEQVYQSGPDVIIAGSAQPAGTAEAVAGGWRVNGRWPFASGCQQADWMFGLCVITEGGKALPGPAGEAGPPLVRGVFLPARDWQIEDTPKRLPSDFEPLLDYLASKRFHRATTAPLPISTPAASSPFQSNPSCSCVIRSSSSRRYAATDRSASSRTQAQFHSPHARRPLFSVP